MIIVVGLHNSKTGKDHEKRILLRGSYQGIPSTPTEIASCDLYQSEGDSAILFHLLTVVQEMGVSEDLGDTKTIYWVDEEKNLPTIDYVFEGSKLRKPSPNDLYPNGVPSVLVERKKFPLFSCA